MISEALLAFIQEHLDEDPVSLTLKRDRYPGIDLSLASRAILARKKLVNKCPSWAQNKNVFVCDSIAVEQCSSEILASYKASLVAPGAIGVDLTGGLGVDSYFFSQKAASWHYMDLAPDRCSMAKHNFGVLGACNIVTHTGSAEKEGVALVKELKPWLVFIDPDRRSSGRRTYSLVESAPNICTLIPLLHKESPNTSYLVKLSPVLDLKYLQGISWPFIADIHVVSYNRECKEILLMISPEAKGNVVVVELSAANGYVYTSSLTPATPNCSVDIGTYLYDPDPGINKVGISYFPEFAHKVWQPHPNTSLFMSNERVPNFPGRVFHILRGGKWSRQIAKGFSGGTFHLSVRNIGTTTEDFGKRWKIKEGGDLFLHLFKTMDNQVYYTLANRV